MEIAFGGIHRFDEKAQNAKIQNSNLVILHEEYFFGQKIPFRPSV